MKLQLLITLLKSIVSLYCCEAYLFYKSHHNGAYDDKRWHHQRQFATIGGIANNKANRDTVFMSLTDIIVVVTDGHNKPQKIGLVGHNLGAPSAV